MSAKATVQGMIDQLQTALVDAEKFDNGNNAAGVRVRAAAQAVTGVCKTLRKDVSATTNERKPKKD